MISLDTKSAPIVIKFHRHRNDARAVLYDDNLDFRSIEELRCWADDKIDFVVIDTETGEDITRILLA
jgi:polyhydroxyalkanoate synthesis regulator protein